MLELEDAVEVAKRAKNEASVDGFNLTDVGNAERLVAAHGDDLRFVPGLGWHIWDDRRFRRDDDRRDHTEDEGHDPRPAGRRRLTQARQMVDEVREDEPLLAEDLRVEAIELE